MRSFLRLLAAAFLLFASASRAGTVPDDHLQPGEGAVLLTVVVDYPSAGMISVSTMAPPIAIERVGADGDPPVRYLLGNRFQDLRSARAYAGSLPPGRYRIHDLDGDDCKHCDDSPWVPKTGDLPEFTIEAGHVRYLGNILATMIDPVPPSKKSTVLWSYTDAPDAALGQRLLTGLYPELAKAATSELLLGWEPNADGAIASAAARDRIRRASSGLSEPATFGADGFLFGAQSGVIKRWNRAEGMRLIDTGSPYQIRAVLRSADGKLLAGGEAGTLLYSADDGRHWSDASSGLPFGVVLQLAALGNDEVVLSLQHGSNAALYRGKFGDNHWTQLGDWPLEFKIWTGVPGALPQLQVQGHQVALTLPSKKGVFLDLDSGETHAIALPGSVANFTFSPDGVMRCTCFHSIAANPWESHDLGRTWGDSPLDRWMLLPVFHDAQHGFTFQGAFMSKSKIGVMITDDGGKTWSQHTPPGGIGAWRAAYSADGSVMLLSGYTYLDGLPIEQMYWSNDESATWNLVVNDGKWLYETEAAPVAH
jgi:hypothetical protein